MPVSFYINRRPPESAGGTNWTQPVNDSVTMSDALAFDRQIVIADSVTMSDSVSFDRTLVLSDSVTVSDALAFDRQKVHADTITMSDSVAFDRQIVIADTVSLADLDSEATGKGVTLADSVTMSDAQVFDRAIVIADTAALVDAVAFQRSWTIADSVTMSDAVRFDRSIVLTETLTLADLASTQTGKEVAVSDSVTMSDALVFDRQIVIVESVTLSDLASPVRTTTGGAATVAMVGYVTGTPGSGTITGVGSGGLVIVGSSSTLGQTGGSGLVGSGYAPQDVCVLGYSNQVLGGVVVGDVETLIGRQFHGLRQNQAYTTTGIATAITEYDAGRTTSYRSIQFDTAPGGWAAVATGVADTQLTAFCTAVTNANRWTTQNPFLVCLHHEATLSPAAGGVFGLAGFSATDYKNMWAHGVPLMLATGAPIAFAYIGWDRMYVGANGVGPPTAGQGVDDLDPGASLYTYIGSDAYNAIDSPGVLRYGSNAATLLEPVRQAAVARGKDWMMGEMGCEDGATTQDHVNKATWLDGLRVYVDGTGITSPGVCRVMLTTIKASAENYNVDSSSESLAAWRRLGFDVYYS